MVNEKCGCGHERAAHSHGTDSCKVIGCGCCEFIIDTEEWTEAKRRWDFEAAQDERLWAEVYAQEDREREDNEPPSGSTDLGNRGGTKFSY